LDEENGSMLLLALVSAESLSPFKKKGMSCGYASILYYRLSRDKYSS
jgi:hypothetical protein